MMGHPSLSPVLEGRAGRLDLVIEAGATFDEEVTWLTRDTPTVPLEQATPVDLTGCAAALVAMASGNEVLRLDTAHGGIVLGGPTGTLRVHLSADETAALPFDTAIYRIDVTFADQTVRALLIGTLIVEAVG